MQQRSGTHYLEAKQKYIDTGKLGKITLARTWWHGNSYHLRKAPASLADAAVEPRLGALPRSGEVARLGSAAVLELARLPRFRRRPGDRPVHALDRRGPHVHGQGHSDVRAWPPAASITTRTAAPRPTPSTCCWNTAAHVHRDLRSDAGAGHPRATASSSAAPRASSTSTAAGYEFTPAGRGATPVVVKGPSYDFTLDHVKNFLDCVQVAEAAERRRADRPPLGAGVAPGQHRLRAEAAAEVRSDPRRDPAAVRIFVCLRRFLAGLLAGQEYDVVIRNGRVFDGSGKRPQVADLAILGDSIAAVGKLPNAKGKTEIEAAAWPLRPASSTCSAGPPTPSHATPRAE